MPAGIYKCAHQVATITVKKGPLLDVRVGAMTFQVLLDKVYSISLVGQQVMASARPPEPTTNKIWPRAGRNLIWHSDARSIGQRAPAGSVFCVCRTFIVTLYLGETS